MNTGLRHIFAKSVAAGVAVLAVAGFIPHARADEPASPFTRPAAMMQRVVDNPDCHTAKDYAAMPAGTSQVADALASIGKDDTVTGPLLYRFMLSSDAYFCAGKLAYGLNGTTDRFAGVVTLNARDTLARMTSTAAHETLHLEQKIDNLPAAEGVRSLDSEQAMMLANEGAAHALEIMFAFEKKLAGDSSLWDSLRGPLAYKGGPTFQSSYVHLTDTFADSYKKASDEGKRKTDALKSAGLQTFYAFMGPRKLLDIYNTDMLERYIAGSVRGTVLNGAVTFGFAGPGIDTWTDQDTRRMGRLSDDFNFTENAAMPAFADRFGTNTDMRWAFEAADLFRVGKYEGLDSEKYKTLRAAAEKGGNPYLNIDMTEVDGAMPGGFFGRATESPVSIMNRLSGHAQPKAAASGAYAYSQQRVEKLAAEVEKSSLGREIMQIRKKHGNSITLVSSARLRKLAGDTKQDDSMTYVGTVMGNTLVLNGEAANDKDLFITIAHETRHVWQSRDIEANAGWLDPVRAMTLYRYKEADAFAFEMYFAYLYEKETGRALISLPQEGSMTAYQSAYALFKLDMDSGMPVETAYKSLMRDMLEFVHMNGYDEAFLDSQEKEWKDHPDKKAKLIRVGVPYQPSNADYLKALRHMGTIGFGGAQPLAAKSDAELTDWDRIGGITAANLRRLNKLQDAYSAAADADRQVKLASSMGTTPSAP